MLKSGKYKVGGRVEPLTLKRRPQRFRMQLDYDSWEVSFYDSKDMTPIYTLCPISTSLSSSTSWALCLLWTQRCSKATMASFTLSCHSSSLLPASSSLVQHSASWVCASCCSVNTVCLSGAWAQGESERVRENDITQHGHSEGRESRASEIEIESRRTEATDTTYKQKTLEDRLSASEKEVEELKRENVALEARLSASEREVEELKRANAGIFTAPVRGVYYFRFTAFDYRSDYNMSVYLYHNDQKQMNNFDQNDVCQSYISNALSLEREQGGVVYMHLPSGCGLYE
ncbi:unnamed protein product, partial [Coregonus sp. 'balchen']